MYTTLSELPKFLGALYGGLVIGVLYDLFRLLGLPFSKLRFVRAVFDALFYAAAGIAAAVTLLYVNGGAPRLYLFLGLALGIFVYARFVGRLFSALFRLIGTVFQRKGSNPKG